MFWTDGGQTTPGRTAGETDEQGRITATTGHDETNDDDGTDGGTNGRTEDDDGDDGTDTTGRTDDIYSSKVSNTTKYRYVKVNRP